MLKAARRSAAGGLVTGFRSQFPDSARPLALCTLGSALALLLAGCAAGTGEPSPRLGALGLLGDLNPFADAQAPYVERAQELPFSSLIYDTGDRRGLVVLGVETGEHTLWPTDNRALLHLHGDGLYATGGLAEDLLHTRYASRHGDTVDLPWRQPEPAPFRLQRSWQTEDGAVLQMQADGTLQCRDATPRTMPLTEVALQRCDMQLSWQDGSKTSATLWRDPNNYRLWEVTERAWPGGPRIHWQVARYWWAS